MGNLTRAGFPFMTEISLCLKWVFAKIKVSQYIFAVIIPSSLCHSFSKRNKIASETRCFHEISQMKTGN